MLSIHDFSFFNLVFGPVYSSIDDFVSQKAIFIKEYFVNKMLNNEVLILQPLISDTQNCIYRKVHNINHLNHSI